MSKDDSKYSKHVVVAYVVFVFIVLGSLLSNIDKYTIFYMVAVIVFVIRYFIAIHTKR